MSDLHVAETILEQLGGRKLMVMTGTKNFVGSENTLTFRLPGKPGFVKNGINFVRIELTPIDDYIVTFIRVRGSEVTEVSKHDNLYAEDLQGVFFSETGLDTHL